MQTGRVLLLLALLLAGNRAPLPAQTAGQIEGIVRDPDGRPAPGTSLRVVESATAAERRLATDQRGWYLAPGLAPGLYNIEVTRAGFRKEVRREVEVSAGRTVRIDFVLALGETSESIVVVGKAPPVSAAPSDWGGDIGQQELQALPFNGRDMFELSSQQPGVTVPTTARKSIDLGLGTRLSVNGARPNQNSFRMDGIYINDATSAAPSSAAGRLLGLEGLQELRLVASPFDAEYGRGGGATFVAVSKSGSNQWRGHAYEYLRNSALDAKNFFDAADAKIPPLRKNQFGVLAGGPLRRDRLFFLANYEGIRLSSSRTMSAVTPSADARRGRLPSGTVPVAAAIVPYLDLYPLPNGRDYGDGTGEFTAEGLTASREDYASGRLDAIPSSRLRWATRFTTDDSRSQSPEALKVFTFHETSRHYFLHNEAQFIQSPSTIHTLRAGFSRVWNAKISSQPPDVPASMSFIPGQQLGYVRMTAGLTSIGGAPGESISLLPRRFVINDFQYNYTLTSIRGMHALRMGGAFDRVHFNQRADRNAKGTYVFSSLADLLQARARTGELMVPGSDSIRGWRQNIISGFVQDEIRASPRLSAALGLRYEAYSTPTEVNGKISNLRDLLHDSTVTLGKPLFRNPSRTNFAPRASVAFLPLRSGKTVIRAGAGVFFDVIGVREVIVAGVRMPPYFNTASVTRPAFPNLLQAAQSAQPANSLDALDYQTCQPYLAQYQFLVQQGLSRDAVLQLGYVGSRGVHLPGQLNDANPFRPEVLADGNLYFPESALRLNPAFGRIRLQRTQFDSSYHAFQAGLEWRWRKGPRLQAKYTWSKSLDNGSTSANKDFASSDGTPTMFNYALNRGRSDFDVRHTAGGNLSWALPSGRGVIGGAVLGGWEIHALIQAQTGPPFNPTVGFDRARLSLGGTTDLGQRPDFIGAPGAGVILGSPRRWFDPGRFALPAAGRYGNLGRNTLNGPGLAALDVALHKVLWSSESRSLRLRVEAFNVSNHPNFQIPAVMGLFDSTLVRLGSAGEITETTTAARQIQLALKWTF
ncbi:MAG: carboxypeptidase regulatory-like domain-containing protein [Bryobacterales bacterium]|nr:carboxypeptidase regulatory-like domain-containing protein [Bryobacterales bacterium]